MHSYLIDSNKPPFEGNSLIQLLQGIAAGMSHLASEGICHRDLAARNVLLKDNGIPKISGLKNQRCLIFADFGMAMIGNQDSAMNFGPVRVSLFCQLIGDSGCLLKVSR